MASQMAATVLGSLVFVLSLLVFPVFLFLKHDQFYQGWTAEHSAEHTTTFVTDFDYSDILLVIVVGGAVSLAKRYRTCRRGKQAGALVKLHQSRLRTLLASIHLVNLCSLPNKIKQIISQTNKDFSNSAALCFK